MVPGNRSERANSKVSERARPDSKGDLHQAAHRLGTPSPSRDALPEAGPSSIDVGSICHVAADASLLDFD